jgi:hypothetical protein
MTPVGSFHNRRRERNHRVSPRASPSTKTKDAIRYHPLQFNISNTVTDARGRLPPSLLRRTLDHTRGEWRQHCCRLAAIGRGHRIRPGNSIVLFRLQAPRASETFRAAVSAAAESRTLASVDQERLLAKSPETRGLFAWGG